MGLLSWFKSPNPKPQAQAQAQSPSEAPNMNGAVSVTRPPPTAEEVTVFEFGSVALSVDKVTLAGFCPVSDNLEPCRWEILPAADDDAPQFRVVF